eukprot:TRINITY_DN9560_c1_g1_i1.p1 TRINITY_DN9560_c1_g1~~TRINITY_DN9560_c1_g1_i1.p1  ORF type:complete len:687 (+),score=88.60 TRINITY_DN9560_c1_g1_i1:40-2100(+)
MLEVAPSPSYSASGPVPSDGPGSVSALGEDDVQPVQLEHAIGFSGRHLGTAKLHPRSGTVVAVHAVGKLVVVVEAKDPHAQQILKGHDAEVTSIDISSSGELLASGQSASTKAKEGDGYIIIWDYQTRSIRQRLPGHQKGVFAISFSEDCKWLASTGVDGKTLIWEVETGRLSGGLRDGLDNEVARAIKWGTIREPGTRRQTYELFLSYNTGIRMCLWAFDIKSMQYRISSSVFQVPGSGGKLGGFVRSYNCLALSGASLLCGTDTGDIVVFNTDTKLYKTSFSVGGGGVLSLTALTDGSVVVGCGDGKISKISRTDPTVETTWEILSEGVLTGGITSMSVSSDGSELLTGTNNGVLYRTSSHDLTSTVCFTAHTSGLIDIAVPPGRSDQFAICADNSVSHVIVWNLDDYSVYSRIPADRTCQFHPSCIAYSLVCEDHLLVGWSNGGIQCFSVSTQTAELQWTIASAHRGKVCALTAAQQFILSAGEDGIVRVWSQGETRSCVAVLQNHTKRVTALLADITSPSIIHTVSLDKTITTFDLAQKNVHSAAKSNAPRKLTYKTDTECSGFISATQRRSGERELVAATYDGVIHMYDIDYQQPVFSTSNNPRKHISSIEINPAGNAFVTSHQDGSLTVYSMDVNKPAATILAQLSSHSSEAVKCVWTADGKQLISIGSDGEICIWNYYL